MPGGSLPSKGCAAGRFERRPVCCYTLPSPTKAVSVSEGRHPSGISRARGRLRLWREVHDPLHLEENPRRNLLGMPSFLHRPTEDDRYRWACGSLQQAVREVLVRRESDESRQSRDSDQSEVGLARSAEGGAVLRHSLVRGSAFGATRSLQRSDSVRWRLRLTRLPCIRAFSSGARKRFRCCDAIARGVGDLPPS